MLKILQIMTTVGCLALLFVNDMRCSWFLDPNKQDIFGYTPLMHAIKNKNSIAIRALMVDPRMDINMKDNNGCSALMHAVKNEDIATVKSLLVDRLIDVNLQDSLKKTALMINAIKGDVNILRVLLADSRTKSNMQDFHGKTALIYATEYKNIDTMRALLMHPLINVSIKDTTYRRSVLDIWAFNCQRDPFFRHPLTDFVVKDNHGKPVLKSEYTFSKKALRIFDALNQDAIKSFEKRCFKSRCH